MAVGDNNYTSYYVYDNGGERTYKLTGKNELMNINGNWMNFAYMVNPTLYTSAYLVAGVQGYTKHYYAGSERVSSAIGLGGLDIIDQPLNIRSSLDWDEKSSSLKNLMRKAVYDCLGHDYNNKKNLQGLYQMTHASSGTMARYFYHPDHIGSSSWITDGAGQAIQHLNYLPFGEDWVDQRNSSWNAPYTFSGKEKDAETGYGYFGARYYDSGLSIWLSVDPMSDKYPSMSPYNYCANNPVILVDPDGREIIVTETINNDGTRTVNITYTAYIRNQSNVEISDAEMQGYIDRIKGSIESVYSGNPQDNRSTTVTTNVDIKILPNENIDSKRHIITITNLPDGIKGKGEPNGMEMRLDISLLPNSPTNNETGFCETSANDTQNTLERTSAHEFGHNAGLPDNNELIGNIMVQSGGRRPGMKFNNNQVNSMIQNSNWRNSPNNDSRRSTNNSDALQRR